MQQPPDEDQPVTDNPRDDTAAGNAFTIDEPPQDADGTRPLKPLRPAPERRPSSAPEQPPPATVLRDAVAAPPEPLWNPLTETNRVRLLPPVEEPPPWRVIFQTVGIAAATIGLDVRQPVLVGRSDPQSEFGPGLDLGPHLAAEQGVSRRHAMLTPDIDHLYLTDLESTNGTWVNGAYLEPGRRHPLATGDQIELGLMRLVVRSVSPLLR